MGDQKQREWLKRIILTLMIILLLLIPGDSSGDAASSEAATEKVPLGEKSGKIAVRTGLLFEK